MREEVEALNEQLDFLKKCGFGDEWTLVDYEEAQPASSTDQGDGEVGAS